MYFGGIGVNRIFAGCILVIGAVLGLGSKGDETWEET